MIYSLKREPVPNLSLIPPLRKLDNLSVRLLYKHIAISAGQAIRRQRHSLKQMEVIKVTGATDANEKYEYYVIGKSNSVYAPKYPKTWFSNW